MRKYFLAITFFSLLSLISGSGAIAEQENKPEAGSTVPTANESVSRVEQEIQNRVKELIKLINQEPNLLVVNPKAKVIKDANWRPYNPDGSVNQDFKVVSDDSVPEIAQALQIEQNRVKWTKELIDIGLPAVEEMVKTVLDQGYKYRHFIVYGLSQIKNIRTVPAILKFFSEGIEQEKLAKTLEQMELKEEAVRAQEEGALKKNTSVEALKVLSGKDFGDEYQKWEKWWKETEKQIGPVELPKIYEAKGASSPSQQYKKSVQEQNPQSGESKP